MPPEQNSDHKSATVRHILFVIVAVVIVSLVVWYFNPRTRFIDRALRTVPPTKLSEEDKYKILDNLAKETAMRTTTEESKLKTLGTLEKQKVPGALSESDKIKLLESLR